MARQPIDTPSPAARPSVDSLAEAVRGNQRAGLARAITLVESTRDDHRALAQQLLLKLLPEAGGAHRIGITGVPAWFMHRGYHGLAMPTWERKIRVVSGWVGNALLNRDIVSLEAREHPRAAFEEFASRPKAAAPTKAAAPAKAAATAKAAAPVAK